MQARPGLNLHEVRSKTDDALILHVMSDTRSTPLEKELALRLHKVISAIDDVESYLSHKPNVRIH